MRNRIVTSLRTWPALLGMACVLMLSLVATPGSAEPARGGLIQITLSPFEADDRWFADFDRFPLPVGADLYQRDSTGNWQRMELAAARFTPDGNGNLLGTLGIYRVGDPYPYSIPPGDYRVQVNVEGYQATTWPAAPSVAEGSNVTIADGNVQLSMRPLGHVGTVAGVARFENGVEWWREGFINWNLRLLKMAPDGSFSEARYPNDRGWENDEFFFNGVPAGRYRLEFGGGGESDCAPFVDQIARSADGAPIEFTVSSGPALKGLDFTIPFTAPSASITSSGNKVMVGSTLGVQAQSINYRPGIGQPGVSWYLNGEQIRSNQHNLTIHPSMAGGTITAQVTGTTCRPVTTPTGSQSYFEAIDATIWTAAVKVGGEPSASTSVATLAKSLRLKGKNVVGRTLRVTSLSTTAKYRFTWFANRKKIQRASKSRLTLTRSLMNKKVSVKVSVTSSGQTRVVRLRGKKVRA